MSAALLSFAGASGAQVQLVTPQEHALSLAAPEMTARAAPPEPGAPRIDVVTPDVDAAIPSPTRIVVKFSATAPAEPNPASFKVYYGALRLDVTKRLLASTQVGKEGLSVDNVSLPKGSHKLHLYLEDSSGRSTRQQVAFSVQ